MFVIIGIIIVFGAVVGGYLMEKGHIQVLFQPAELVIIAGAALGTLLVANPPHILKKIVSGFKAIFSGSRFSKQKYLNTLKMMYELFTKARKEGLMALESDSDAPDQSAIFTKYPEFMADHHALAFVCDTLRTASSAMIEPFDADQMMEMDMEAHHHQALQPISALSTVADSLPGLGIVAAVLGVVITMGALGGPPEEIGHKVAAALVGTFLGILLCYGLVGPIAANLSKLADEENAHYQVLRVLLNAFMKGISPIMAVELGRRSIPSHVRPTFQEAESYCRNKDTTASEKETAAA
jgi:chemotaxis protein MotA